MKLFDIFKKKEEPKEEPPKRIEPLRLTTNVRTPEGLIEMDNDTILRDGTCLFAEGGQYYHTHVGCYTKWSVPFKGWQLMKVDDAKKQGLVICLICKGEEESRQNFDWLDDDWSDEY